MIKIFNRHNMAENRSKDRQTALVHMFKGNALENKKTHSADAYGQPIEVVNTGKYAGSQGEANLLYEIEALQKAFRDDPQHALSAEEAKKYNAAQYPGQTAIEAILGKMYIDITRRAMDNGDMTSLLATEANDPNSDENVNVNFFYRYVGKMGEVAGSNDSVNLIEQKTGGTDVFPQKIYALGWKDTLANLLFNKIHSIAKVDQAAADADIDNRNNLTIGTIVGTTFVASQSQAADATSGATFDVLMYNTLRKGIKKLRNLKDVQTGRKVSVPGIAVLCNSANTWDISRVINGQLTNNGGGSGDLTSVNLQALPISSIIEYDQGITDGFVYGKDTLSFPGVTAGTCYLLIPNEYMFVMNKRGLTLETGTGSTLQLSTEEKAWYRVFGVWMKDFLGSSYPGTSIGAGYGAIIEVTLPTDS